MLSSRLSFHLVMLLAVFAVSSSAGLVPSPEPEPSKAELEGCFKHNNDVHKCIANPSCVWCLAYKTGHQCAHTKDPIFKQNYAPKLKSHIDEMCANPATLNDVFKKAKTAFAHSFQHTAGLDLQAVPTTRRFFAARLIVAVSTDKFTYLYELSSGSSNANKLAINGVKGSDIAVSTAGFWLPVGGFTKPYDEKCEITSTVCDAAFLTTAQLYKPSEEDGGADPTAMAALRAGGSPKDPKIKKEKKDKNAKPFSNHLLVPILERFTSIEQLQISIILSSYCETIFNGVTGLSKPCYDEWRAKCIAASNAWAVFRQNRRLASLPPTPKPLVAAVEAAVKTQYHMAYSDVEAMQMMTNLHHEKPIFAFTGSRFGDLAATLMGYKSCKVPDYIEGTLSEHTAPQK